MFRLPTIVATLPGIKTVVVRQSEATKEIRVTLITIDHKIKNLMPLAKEIMKLDGVCECLPK